MNDKPVETPGADCTKPEGEQMREALDLLRRVVRTIDEWDHPSMEHPFAKYVTPAVRAALSASRGK